jgi:hypothetical protein
MDVYQRRRLVALSILAGIFILIVLLARGCGDDEEEPNPLTTPAGASGLGGATPLTQDQFIDQGDLICIDANTALADLDESDTQQFATDSAELLAGELNSLQSLTLAEGEKGQKKLNNFLEALEQQVQGYNDLITAIDREDDTAIAEIETTIEEAASEAQRTAKRFGFEACGDPSQVSESGGEGGEEDTSGVTETTTTPVEPTTPPVETAPVEPTTPPADTGGGTAPPADTGGDTGGDSGSGSGGLTP